MDLMQYIDLAWIALAPFLVKRRFWLKTTLFILACFLMLRFQIELMEVVGFSNGFFDILDTPLLQRGIITYALFIAGFLILAHFSPASDRYVFIGAAITVFFTAFIASTIVLLL